MRDPPLTLTVALQSAFLSSAVQHFFDPQSSHKWRVVADCKYYRAKFAQTFSTFYNVLTILGLCFVCSLQKFCRNCLENAEYSIFSILLYNRISNVLSLSIAAANLILILPVHIILVTRCNILCWSFRFVISLVAELYIVVIEKRFHFSKYNTNWIHLSFQFSVRIYIFKLII